ncbi:MAG: hypothetical protein IJQ89_04060, partial [Bacteroidales bacterium]|nr:hypothetical protein [Bacteroidales bacterium]
MRDTISRILCDNQQFDTVITEIRGEHVNFNWNLKPDTIRIERYSNPRENCQYILIGIVEGLPTYDTSVYDTMCVGHPGKYSYMFPPGTLITEGIYTFQLTTIHGCDSVVKVHVKIPDSTVTHLFDTICAGGTSTRHGGSYTFTEPGDTAAYRQFHTVFGCDSLVVIHIHVEDTLRDTIWETICAGQTFDTNGYPNCRQVNDLIYPPYYVQGVYTQQYRDTITGCYHNLVIALTVNDTLRDTISKVICAGETFDTNRFNGYLPVDGQNYPPYTQSGV